MKPLKMFAVPLLLMMTSAALAGDIAGQSRGLDGAPVSNLTVTVVNANNQVIARQFFADGAFSIAIQDNLLFAGNQAVTILFAAPGRDTARLDNVLGSQVGQRIDVVLPLKLQSKDECVVYACCCRRGRRCR